MREISPDKRRRIYDLYRAGETCAEIARRCNCSYSTARKYVALHEQDSSPRVSQAERNGWQLNFCPGCGFHLSKLVGCDSGEEVVVNYCISCGFPLAKLVGRNL